MLGLSMTQPNLEMNKFADWLDQQPAERTFGGEGPYNDCCPLACYLREGLGHKLATVSGSCYVVATDQIRAAMLPPWAANFIAFFDGHNDTDLSAAKVALRKVKERFTH